MDKSKSIFQLSKKQKFVALALVLSTATFISESFIQYHGLFTSLGLALFTDLILFLILRRDLGGFFYYTIFILPFLFTLSFNLFYLLIPPRFLARALTTVVFGFGLYSLFLTQNIFAVSSIRTINLLRSARIVTFVMSIVVFFLLMNYAFSFRTNIFLMSGLVFSMTFILNFQLFWAHSLDKSVIGEVLMYALINSFVMLEMSLVLMFWPISATIYAIFLSGIFYSISGLAHAWFEKRLFKGLLWEYIWVGFLFVLILMMFSKWGI